LKALIIGGTGPTGPHIINGLVERGYDVTMLNRGSRDSEAIPASVERVIGDPHFPDTLEQVLAGRQFDLAIATYGRIRYVAEVLADKTNRLITIGGPPSYRGFADPAAKIPAGMPVPAPEDAQRVEAEAEDRFSYLIRRTEDAVMQQHAEGHMNVTHFRYPVVYGPWQVQPMNFWWIMQRYLDGRKEIAMADGGLTIATRGYSENMAHAVLLAADQPGASAGKIYNCGDELQFTLAGFIELITSQMGEPAKLICIPDQFASTSRDMMMFRRASHHQLLDIHNIRHDLGYRDLVPANEGVRRTVDWVLQNPPTDPEFIAAVRSQYEIEDQLLAIYHRSAAEMAALKHNENQFHHAYAHPKERGLVRDHRDR
jgi:nucleoside-diphosphate-sugar epimerase